KELKCFYSDLQGQVTVSAVLTTVESFPDEAEFFLVFRGSSQEHITEAQKSCFVNTLHFVVPGHNTLEDVSITGYIYTEGNPVSPVGKASLLYVQDEAHELAQFLVEHSHCLSRTSHQEVIARFGLLEENRRRKTDEKVTMAMANFEFPYTWNILGSQAGEEPKPRESLLHLAVRLGLIRLSQFLLCQPGGLMALSLPNEEGVTPLQLANQSGHQALVELLTNFKGLFQAGISQIQADGSRLLKFCHLSETLTLTVRPDSERTLESDILLLRKRLKDNNFLRECLKWQGPELLNSFPPSPSMTEKTFKGKISYRKCQQTRNLTCTKLLNTFQNDYFMDHIHFISTSFFMLMKPQIHSTFTAASRLSAMLNGKDEIYANSMLVDKVDDLDIKYSIDGVTTESTQTDSCASDLRQGRLSHSGVHFPEEAGSSACCNHISEHCGDERHTSNNAGDREQFPSVSPANLALARLNQPHRPHVFNKEGSPPQNSTCTLSPNLVALEVDSEDDDTLDKSPLSQASTSPQSVAALQPSSADEQDSFDTSPELSSSRARSLSSHTNTLSKESGDPGIRLRSYSYSSPKISLSRPRFSRDTNISDLTEEQRAFSLPEHPREKRIEEEEWDKYIIPSKSESEKYKVSRTFSFLKSRMSSTRSKNKGKNKDKEGKEKLVNGHQFLAGSCSGLTLCLVCDKPAIGKELLQCSNCTINVHKGCRDSSTPCLKKLQDKYGVTVKSKTASLPLTSSTREIPHSSGSLNTSSPSLPVMMAKDTKREQSYQAHPLSKSASAVTERFRRLSEGMEADVDSSSWRGRSQSEEILQVMGTSPSTDSFIIEDTVDVPLRSDFSADLLDYEAESWSLYVDPKFCSKQEKRVIKRQDVIYELMQTEMHHIQTLTIMSEIFRRGMKEQLQLDHYTVDKIFPCLDELFDIHKSFFSAMKERRQHGTEENNDRNFLIDRIGDVLVQQFSDENATKMKQVYGEFCSHHTEAVNFFKELQQQNKKFQAFIKQQSNNSLVRRREIPECILLVTQRITKYPVLVERILQHSKEGTEEHADLIRALSLIREVIAAVDLKVSEYEKEQKLVEILNRIENKTFAKLKNGHTFRKQDLMSQGRTLQHDGLVYWKTATGRLKDIMALLLTDVLIFLQEKDQKYIFATVDQKPPVISLQKLIVREVANEERGMFLISASSAGPEMYEIHTASKEERNNWMRLIREAVESCPEEEEERTSETEEDKRAAEARAQKIQKFQETLINQDQQICNSLEEKLRIYAELTVMSVNEESAPDPHLLIRPDPEEVPQAAVLLAAALREAEKLTAALTSQSWSSDSQSQDAVGSILLKSTLSSADYPNTQSSSSVSLTSDSEMREGEWSGDILQSLTEDLYSHSKWIYLRCRLYPDFEEHKVVQSVQSLTQLLYSLQAAVTIQDSCYEVQKLILQENERLPRLPSSRGNLLQEQEKQRNLEKQREELAGAQRLQNQLRQEQQRWERECELRQRQQGEKESQLEHRERDCHLQAEQLQRDREELEAQLREYQHSLERLREGQQLVEKEREKLETQQSMLQGWRHNRQRSLPVMMIPLDSNQGTSHSRSESFDGDGSVFVNEAALQMSLNSHHRTSSLVYTNNPSAHNNLNSVIARTNDKQGNQRTD
uniref:Rho guanine nucleotide exchange factor 28 n=1 Tax=Lepisosteus oculatus TaxID=7918 RepID=W5MYV0_LEPOC